MKDISGMRQLLQYCQDHRDETVALARRLVELESPTGEKAAADLCARFLAGELERRGARVTVHAQPDCGDHLEARFSAAGDGREAAPVLLLGHYDTVWELGTLARRPCCESEGRLYGPGVFDMKAGIALMLAALDAWTGVCGALPRPVIVSLNGDEEGGSLASRSRTEALAAECAAVLVTEPAQGTAVKTARKGIGGFTLKVTGVSAHPGLDFARGQNAIVELARQIEQVSGFTDEPRGLTVNVGFVRGGTVTANVVPAEALAEVDVRIAKAQDAAEIEQRFQALRPFNPHCRMEVVGGIRRPAWERAASTGTLYEVARGLAAELGFELGEAAVGGGSDGNFTAALGIPTLDGLGAIGQGAHAEDESILIDWLPQRAALLAGLIQRV